MELSQKHYQRAEIEWVVHSVEELSAEVQGLREFLQFIEGGELAKSSKVVTRSSLARFINFWIDHRNININNPTRRHNNPLHLADILVDSDALYAYQEWFYGTHPDSPPASMKNMLENIQRAVRWLVNERFRCSWPRLQQLQQFLLGNPRQTLQRLYSRQMRHRRSQRTETAMRRNNEYLEEEEVQHLFRLALHNMRWVVEQLDASWPREYWANGAENIPVNPRRCEVATDSELSYFLRQLIVFLSFNFAISTSSCQ